HRQAVRSVAGKVSMTPGGNASTTHPPSHSISSAYERETPLANWSRSRRQTPRALRRRVWNGICAAGDGRAKRDLKTISLRRDRKSETTTCEKSPQKRLFC